MDTTSSDRVETLVARIDETLEQSLDYAESHVDAGDAYTHMPREGGWAYTNGDERLAAWIAKMDIPRHGLEIDEISEIVLDNFRMMSGSILDPSSSDETLFVVDSYPVQEVETQIDLSTLMPKATQAERAEARKTADAYFGAADMAYQVSDRVWYAVINRATLVEAIAKAA